MVELSYFYGNESRLGYVIQLNAKLHIMVTPKKLTNLQLELLKVFRYDLPEQQLLEIREMLKDYFVQHIDQEMDALWEAQNWSAETMETWSKAHLRTPYAHEGNS